MQFAETIVPTPNYSGCKAGRSSAIKSILALRIAITRLIGALGTRIPGGGRVQLPWVAERSAVEDRRGQTNLDFILGVTILVVAVVFVWLFLPNLFGPFVDGDTHSDSLAAERAANNLAEDAFKTTPGADELDEDCVVAFFMGSSSAPGCGFSGSTLTEQIGLGEFHVANVSAEFTNGTVLAWNGPGVGGFSDSGTPKLIRGGTHGSTSDVSVARRVVSIDGQRAVLVVRVW